MTRVLLVVADPLDPGGRAAAERVALPPGPGSVRGAGLDAVVVTGDELARAGWTHEVAPSGAATTRVRLPAPHVGELSDDGLAAVWFRSRGWRPARALRAAPEGDQAYARSELTALFVSWLASLGPRCVNACDGVDPTGPSWTQPRWRQLARELGLGAAGGDSMPVRSVLVAGAVVVGARDSDEVRAALALAEAAGCRILEIGFDGSGSVTGVTAVPALLAPGHVEAAAAALREVAS